MENGCWELGRKVQLFNGSLRKAREAKGLSQNQLANAVGLSAGTINSFESMKRVPSMDSAKKIADYLGTSVLELFPVELLRELKDKPKTEISYAKAEWAELTYAAKATHLLEDKTDLEHSFEMAEKKELLSEAIRDSLTDREKRVISELYGLDGGRGKTLEEVAEIFDVGRERIRQIHERALSRLRHNTKVRAYKRDYYGEEGEPELLPKRERDFCRMCGIYFNENEYGQTPIYTNWNGRDLRNGKICNKCMLAQLKRKEISNYETAGN